MHQRLAARRRGEIEDVVARRGGDVGDDALPSSSAKPSTSALDPVSFHMPGTSSDGVASGGGESVITSGYDSS